MGLFGFKKSNPPKKPNLKELANIDVKYINDLSNIIADSAGTIVEIHDTCDDIDDKYPETAIKIASEAVEILRKAIEELKNFNDTTSPPLIKKYESRTQQLNTDIMLLLKEIANRDR